MILSVLDKNVFYMLARGSGKFRTMLALPKYTEIYVQIQKIIYSRTHLFISGLCLNFSSALVMTLILRHTITKCRNIGLGTYLPLDHNIYLHKLTGYIIFVLAWLHAIMHMCNLGTCLEFQLSHSFLYKYDYRKI